MPPSPICVDASFVVRLILSTEDQGSSLLPYWDRWEAEQRQIVAPSLFRYEITNAFYRYQRAGMRSADITERALTLALSLPIQFRDVPEIHRQALRIAARFRLPAAYDAHYVALAEQLECELWTADQRLFNTVGGELSRLRLVDVHPTGEGNATS